MNVLTLCEEGNYEKLKEILTKSNDINFDLYGQLWSCACVNGHIKIVNLFINHLNKYADIVSGFYYSTLGNNKNVVDILLEKYFVLVEEQKKLTNIDLLYLVYGACQGGNLKLLKKLIKEEIITSELLEQGKVSIFEFACKGGHKDVIDFLIEYKLYNWEAGFTGACKGGQFEIAKWIYKEAGGDDVDYVNVVFTHGVRGGNLQLILWAKEIVEHENYKYGSGIPWDEIFNIAAEEGHLEIVIWVTENYRKYVDLYEGFRRACSNGKKSVADWLIEKSKKTSWKTWAIYKDITQLDSVNYYTNWLKIKPQTKN